MSKTISFDICHIALVVRKINAKFTRQETTRDKREQRVKGNVRVGKHYFVTQEMRLKMYVLVCVSRCKSGFYRRKQKKKKKIERKDSSEGIEIIGVRGI